MRAGPHRGAQQPTPHPSSSIEPTNASSEICNYSNMKVPQTVIFLMSRLFLAPLLHAAAGALHTGRQKGSKKQITSGQPMLLLCKISEQENGIWSFSLMSRDWMTGLKLLTHCSVTPLSLYCGGCCLEERVICSKLYRSESRVNMDHIQLYQLNIL